MINLVLDKRIQMQYYRLSGVLRVTYTTVQLMFFGSFMTGSRFLLFQLLRSIHLLDLRPFFQFPLPYL